GAPQLEHLDPFLLLDEFKSDRADDYAAGFPDHPHRGFETVTYMLAGSMLHRDHSGNEGHLVAGSVQFDVSLPAGARWRYPLAAGHNAFCYVFEGRALVGPEDRAREVRAGQLAVLGEGDTVTVATADAPARFLLVAARPLGEPIARYGPFVMNTREEVMQAFRDFSEGSLGT
ncbi:MAG TPA: pirin-like C-terminal cupin domain-containing protein, partial [Vicinamibacteria bacterium]